MKKSQIPSDMLHFLSKQLNLSLNSYHTYILDSKTARKHKQEILDFFGFKEEQDEETFIYQVSNRENCSSF
ncbi:DUF4158 domain-containing protein [Bacillus sp. FSL K6-0268]|uniref:DUF4158 domain-containing protein n=1 Tax=Bacillus sp. FSL K6-0268 TaxID=2921449 RepID=UPI0030F51D76